MQVMLPLQSIVCADHVRGCLEMASGSFTTRCFSGRTIICILKRSVSYARFDTMNARTVDNYDHRTRLRIDRTLTYTNTRRNIMYSLKSSLLCCTREPPSVSFNRLDKLRAGLPSVSHLIRRQTQLLYSCYV